MEPPRVTVLRISNIPFGGLQNIIRFSITVVAIPLASISFFARQRRTGGFAVGHVEHEPQPIGNAKFLKYIG